MAPDTPVTFTGLSFSDTSGLVLPRPGDERFGTVGVYRDGHRHWFESRAEYQT